MKFWGVWHRGSLLALLLPVSGAVGGAGCTDPGEADWQKCQELEKADQLDGAIAACNAAYEKSPQGELGMNARTKAVALAAAQASRAQEIPAEFQDDVDARNAQAEKTRERLVKLVEEADQARIAALEELIKATSHEETRKSYEEELAVERKILDSDGPDRKKLVQQRDRIQERRVDWEGRGAKAPDALEGDAGD